MHAPTLDTEVSEIARRIVQAHDNGRPWREMGVLVRSEDDLCSGAPISVRALRHPCALLLLVSLTDAPAVRFFRALMEALLSGWDHVATLKALRLPGSPLEAGGGGRRVRVCRSQTSARQPVWTITSARRRSNLNRPESARFTDTMGDRKGLPKYVGGRLGSSAIDFCADGFARSVSHELALLWRSHAAA